MLYGRRCVIEGLLIAGVVILIIAGIAVGQYMSHKRRQAIAAWAHSKGWSYRKSRSRSIPGTYDAWFDLFNQGSNRYAYNIVQGSVSDEAGSYDLEAFDYHYETYSTDSKGRRQTHHHHNTSVILKTGLPLRELAIRPEGWFDKVTEFFGYDDIDFELDEFSRSFHVKAPDRQWAFDVIHQETMEYMLAMPRYTIHMANGYVMIFKTSTLSVQQWEEAISLGSGILARLPQYLRSQWEQQGLVRDLSWTKIQ